MFQKIRKQVVLIALLVFIAALAAPSLASAGGWVVITLDQMPENVQAGQPYTIGMMARQHGISPLQVAELRIETRQPETGQTLKFAAKPEGQPGHYQAELLFSEPGRWEWGIESGLFPALQPMPAIEVASASAAAAVGSAAEPAAGAVQPLVGITPLVLGLLAVLALAAAAVVFVRGRNKQARLLAGLGLVIVCGALAFAFFSSAQAEARQGLPAAQVLSGAVSGQQLFLAKGCVVCHVNERAIENSENYSVNTGPILSVYRNDSAYLHEFLANPSAVRPGVEMPNLELAPEEIDALVNFINDQE